MKTKKFTIISKLNLNVKIKTILKAYIFILLKSMAQNLENSEKMLQWFMVTIYYAIPRNNNQFLLLIIVGYNHEEKKLR